MNTYENYLSTLKEKDRNIIEKWKEYIKEFKFKTHYALITTCKYANYHYEKLGNSKLKESLKILTYLLFKYDKKIKLQKDSEDIEELEISASISWKNIHTLKNNGNTSIENVIVEEIKTILINKLEENLYLYIQLLLINLNVITEKDYYPKLVFKSKVRFIDIVGERQRKLNKIK